MFQERRSDEGASRCRRPCRRSSPAGWTPCTRRRRRSSATRRCVGTGSGSEHLRTSAACAAGAGRAAARRAAVAGSSSARSRAAAVAEESQYTFWHVLVRDVAYAQIPRGPPGREAPGGRRVDRVAGPRPRRPDRASRPPLHERARVRAARPAGRPGLADRARIALRDAGEHALGVYAYAAAARFFRDALELWPADDPGPAAAAVRAREVAVLVGARRATPSSPRRAMRWSQPATSGRAAQADVLLCRLCSRPGRPRRGVSHAAAAVELLRGSAAFARAGRGDQQPRGVLCAAWGSRSRTGGERRGARPRRGARSSTRSGPRALTFRGHARIVARRRRTGIEDLEQAVEVAEEAALARSRPQLCEPRDLARRARPAGAGMGRLRAGSSGRGAVRRRGRPPLARGRAAVRALLARQLGRGAGRGRVLAAGARRRARVGHAGSSVRAWIRLARGDEAGALEDSADRARVRPPGEGAAAALCQGRALSAGARRGRTARRGGATGRRGGRRGLRPGRPPVLLDGGPRRCLAPARQARRPACRRKGRLPLARRGPPPAQRLPCRRRGRLCGNRSPTGGGEGAATRLDDARREREPRRCAGRARARTRLLPRGRRRRLRARRPIRSSPQARARSSRRASSTGAGSRRRPSRRRGRGPSTMSH